MRVQDRQFPQGGDREQLLAAHGVRVVVPWVRDSLLHSRPKKALLTALFEPLVRGVAVPAAVQHERGHVSIRAVKFPSNHSFAEGCSY